MARWAALAGWEAWVAGLCVARPRASRGRVFGLYAHFVRTSDLHTRMAAGDNMPARSAWAWHTGHGAPGMVPGCAEGSCFALLQSPERRGHASLLVPLACFALFATFIIFALKVIALVGRQPSARRSDVPEEETGRRPRASCVIMFHLHAHFRTTMSLGWHAHALRAGMSLSANMRLLCESKTRPREARGRATRNKITQAALGCVWSRCVWWTGTVGVPDHKGGVRRRRPARPLARPRRPR